ncbi:hypothetical protein BW247_05015 [Acidihalobacter ferrooxydans]|uniref:UvrD-like helicase C-terminal domain-containing protein n=2 Tax=Acidihalobacter ferrooxydans TaxID=1765967 RepID=A0A1P8UFF9_9GAMM|nr:hypothetical protein BW247_05015 [Acidihalobacter ferrooxydans]
MNADQTRVFDELRRFIREPSGQRVLKGYAGTGKTWLLVQVVMWASSQGIKTAVCAPTHKAVAVIREKLDVAPTREGKNTGPAAVWTGTLHALLGLRLKEDRLGSYRVEIDRNHDNEYFENYQLVVIDESSMVGDTLLDHIHAAQQRGDVRVLYVGDPGQLLPVEDPPNRGTDAGSLLARLPPVFETVPRQHTLNEIVRQKATGRPHPIAQFAQVIRAYIEGGQRGLFTPEGILDYVSQHSDSLAGRVRIASVSDIGTGLVKLRRARPHADIRAVAWRNRVVDQHNAFVHRELADLYASSKVRNDAPFWPGETIIAREMLHAFPAGCGSHWRGASFWEGMLSPREEKSSRQNKDKTNGGFKPVLIQNNTEMAVIECRAMDHPYLQIPSWRILTSTPEHGKVEFYIADDAAEHNRIKTSTWGNYRKQKNPILRKEEFGRAWTVTRACAPVMHAYAMTAHKSQGSTFYCSIVDVLDLYGMVKVSGAEAYHRALYVAVTRASDYVRLCI